MSRKKEKYYWQESDRYVSVNELADLSVEEQIEVMRYWFKKHYENPVDRMPYESKEGGYIYISGGPYDAREELSEEFQDMASQMAINKLVEELEEESMEWAGVPSDEK
ncbi:hypothetical protein DPQ33_13915 [Oceanidesulfovibrio indonesiensis]|uniref:HEPN/RES N-terminal domain-containing protein n=1 Tax=Oceanidesulfovibrio indonesiensis TaxID=54767 RepID=A0A7M3MBV0_9BACT|nr:HEPN-associated N-terminal domain-containing protein [Oceanidesulfovibrio indonesiensis]TVM15796.1 hypothetical protein DPQ33_13915 [Oceanidesulfovibrio indonesiensis]